MSREAEAAATESLHEAIQQCAGAVGAIEGSVLVGWVLMAEWMDGEGARWMSKVSRAASGQPCPPWQSGGYLHEGLHGFNGLASEDEDDDGG